MKKKLTLGLGLALALTLAAFTFTATATETPAPEAPAVETQQPQQPELALEDLLAPEAQPQSGICQGPPKKDCNCITLWDPVCGCNGVTYSNSCFAQCDGVKEWTEGECGSSSTI